MSGAALLIAIRQTDEICRCALRDPCESLHLRDLCHVAWLLYVMSCPACCIYMCTACTQHALLLFWASLRPPDSWVNVRAVLSTVVSCRLLLTHPSMQQCFSWMIKTRMHQMCVCRHRSRQLRVAQLPEDENARKDCLSPVCSMLAYSSARPEVTNCGYMFFIHAINFVMNHQFTLIYK